jgi:putative hydrolase of the HAD superfamily
MDTRGITTVIFDLDETLIEDSAATERAMEKISVYASQRHTLEARQLRVSAYRHAQRLWEDSPTYAFCECLGISFTEGMWGRFQGDGPAMQQLYQWTPIYQQQIWQLALADQQITDDQLAAELAEIFHTERRNYYLFPETEHILNALRPHYRLAMLTNGASDLQNEKIVASKLASYFEVIVISGDIGKGKPHPDIFTTTLKELSVQPEEAVMIGDNPRNDIFGAWQIGMRGIWINPERQAPASLYASAVSSALTIEHLGELSGLLL